MLTIQINHLIIRSIHLIPSIKTTLCHLKKVIVEVYFMYFQKVYVRPFKNITCSFDMLVYM